MTGDGDTLAAQDQAGSRVDGAGSETREPLDAPLPPTSNHAGPLMPRPAKGQVIEDTRGRTKIYALRFRAYGKREYLSLGTTDEGWTFAKAEEELDYILKQVRRGVWSRPQPPPPLVQAIDPSFHEFASEWLEHKRLELKREGRPENTYDDYRWQLTSHLLPFFRDHRLSEVTIQEVDRYRHEKVRARDRIRDAQTHGQQLSQRPVGNTTINKTIARLAQILDEAIEYGWLDTNPARGRRRRLPRSRPEQTFLELDEVVSLLDAAGELEREARDDRKIGRRALLATMGPARA